MSKKERRKQKRMAVPVLVALLGLGVGACDMDPAADDPLVAAKRDVYQRVEDCVADWGDKTLCQQMEQTAQKEAREKQAGAVDGPSHAVVYYPFYGPTYYGNERVVVIGNREIRPLANHAASFKSTAVKSSSLPSSVSRSIAARGGFGSAGRAVAAGGRVGGGS